MLTTTAKSTILSAVDRLPDLASKEFDDGLLLMWSGTTLVFAVGDEQFVHLLSPVAVNSLDQAMALRLMAWNFQNPLLAFHEREGIVGVGAAIPVESLTISSVLNRLAAIASVHLARPWDEHAEQPGMPEPGAASVAAAGIPDSVTRPLGFARPA